MCLALLGFLALGDLGYFFFIYEPLRLHSIIFLVLALPQTDLSLEPAMFLTSGETEIIAASGGEPADLFGCIFSTGTAGHGDDHAVLHGLRLGCKWL